MKFNKKRFLLRILVSPFILGMLMTTFLFAAVRRWFFFLIHGGEFINYEKDENGKTIQDVYKLVEEHIKKQE